LQRIETIKRNVTNQILINHIGLVLTWEDVQDILHAINVYRGCVVSMFPRTDKRDSALATVYTWQKRFQAVLEILQPET
jgi:hypothetical protein